MKSALTLPLLGMAVFTVGAVAMELLRRRPGPLPASLPGRGLPGVRTERPLPERLRDLGF